MTRGKQRLVMAEGVGLPAEAAHVSFDLSRTPTETDEEDEEDEEVEDNELDCTYLLPLSGWSLCL